MNSEKEVWILERKFEFWKGSLNSEKEVWSLKRKFEFWKGSLNSEKEVWILKRKFEFWKGSLNSGKEVRILEGKLKYWKGSLKWNFLWFHVTQWVSIISEKNYILEICSVKWNSGKFPDEIETGICPVYRNLDPEFRKNSGFYYVNRKTFQVSIRKREKFEFPFRKPEKFPFLVPCYVNCKNFKVPFCKP